VRDETAVPEGGSAARAAATGRGAREPVAGATSPHPRGLRNLVRRITPASDPHSLPVSLFRYVMQFSLPQQAVLLLLTLASLPVYYVSLDLPKQIVDRAIGGAPAEFPKAPAFAGIEFGPYSQVEYLAFLSGLFLLAVLVNGGLKYALNVYKGRLGEGMLRRLRAQLLGRILRFPLPQFRKLSQGELIAMVTGEVEALGGYFGDALVTPVFQAGLLLTALGFIFAQDLIMGLAAIALYPLQAYVIPKLQRQVNLLGFARIREVRRLSQRIGEVTGVIEDVHANYADRTQLATFGQHLDRIFGIRYDIYRKKFFIKFLNNFIAQLTPFFFLSIGGYLVLRGSLTLGSLVAVLAAYKDLAPPWKELLDFYQIQQDARIKYAQLRVQFDPPGLRPPLEAEAPDDEEFVLEGTIEAADLGLEDDGHVLLDQVSLRIPAGQHVALLNENGEGGQALFRMLARLAGPTSGRLMLDGQELSAVPRASYARQVAVVPSPARLTQGTVAENLLLRLGGHVAAGGPSDLALRETLAAFDRVELCSDMFQLGLRTVVDPGRHAPLVEAVLAARSLLHERLEEAKYAGIIESFERDRYVENATLGENLIFGVPLVPEFEGPALARNALVRRVLREVALEEELIALAREAWRNLSELFGGLPAHHPFFANFSPIRSEDLPLYRQRLGPGDGTLPLKLTRERRSLLLGLALNLAPARDRLVDLQPAVIEKLLQARQLFAAKLPAAAADAVDFFDPGRYLATLTVRDNLIFGRIVAKHGRASERLSELISWVADEGGFREGVIAAGLDFTVGIGGAHLTPQQRQKLLLAAALLKRDRARLVVADSPTGDLERGAARRLLQGLLEAYRGRTVVCVVEDPGLTALFDRTVVLDKGRVVADGPPTELQTVPVHAAVG
jgi:ABC-type multidrug transport system fused ATPase/permease subunit